MRHAFLALLMLGLAVKAGTEFDAGNRAYDEGRFLEARQQYEAQVARGEWTANLFYNLGNANVRIGSPGLAMLSYERALVLQPSHTEARANLKFLREQSLAKVPALTWRDHAFGVLNFDGWLVAFSLAAWATIFMLVLPYARHRRLTASGAFFLVLALCAAGYAGCAAWETMRELDAGVVVAKQAEARQAPADRAALADVLPAGSRLRVMSVRGEWAYCELPGGGTGWLPSPAVQRVRLPN
jgi:tetratricopeptide (TPR) repeat protein